MRRRRTAAPTTKPERRLFAEFLRDTVPMPPKTAARKTAAPRVKQAKPAMSAQHKQALAVGREESRAVRRYLEALQAHKPKRGRKRTAEGIAARLQQIDARLPNADALTRVHLVQERMNLQAELASKGETVDVKSLEDAFVEAARGYGERKGLTYAAWRAAGVDPTVLRRAGIPRTRS
jgi:hypothetical protein